MEVYVNKFSHTRFEPMGPTTNPEIRLAKSIVDYIFRWLGITFLPGFREANSQAAAFSEPPKRGDDSEGELSPAATKAGGPSAKAGLPKATSAPAPSKSAAPSHTNGHNHARNGNGATAAGPKVEKRLDWTLKPSAATGLVSRADQFASFQADAPACDNCGAITVRNGNCYLCHNCGNSMGCS